MEQKDIATPKQKILRFSRTFFVVVSFCLIWTQKSPEVVIARQNLGVFSFVVGIFYGRRSRRTAIRRY
ncbi:MAG: hypothetical protein ACR2HF_13895 [Methylococcaceae bacterium]